MSVTVPFFGVLLVQDARRRNGRQSLAPPILAALVLAVLFAVFGIVVCSLITAEAHAQVPDARWDHVGTIIVGSILVQVLAQLTGTGFGLLVRRRTVACLFTVVLPLGLWLFLGVFDESRPARAWLTPYASAQNLLSGDMNATRWTQWLVTIVTWGVGLNLVSLRIACRARPKSS